MVYCVVTCHSLLQHKMEDGFPELYIGHDSNYGTSSLPVELSHVISLYQSQVNNITIWCIVASVITIVFVHMYVCMHHIIHMCITSMLVLCMCVYVCVCGYMFDVGQHITCVTFIYCPSYIVSCNYNHVVLEFIFTCLFNKLFH